LQTIGYDRGMDVWERIRYARDRALEAEEIERQRLAEAETVELQQAASVRLATRQAVREALDDVLGEQSEPTGGKASGGAAGVEMGNADNEHEGADVGEAREDASDSLVGTATTADTAERSYAGAGTPTDDVQEEPGSQVTG
jgi:membrane protein involved in colicin uptake